MRAGDIFSLEDASDAIEEGGEMLNAKKTPKLKQEIDSWSHFVESLRLEDREAFRSMVQKIWAYSDSVEICKDEYTTEAFLIGILLSQQKTINWLENQLLLREKKSFAGVKTNG